MSEEKECCSESSEDCHGQEKQSGTEGQCCKETASEQATEAQVEDCGKAVTEDCSSEDCCRDK